MWEYDLKKNVYLITCGDFVEIWRRFPTIFNIFWTDLDEIYCQYVD